jgi:hypothetical protein
MPIEGTILEIMETWPLQLVISGSQGRIHVALREDTEVRRSDGTSGGVRLLRPGARVRIDGNTVVLLD